MMESIIKTAHEETYSDGRSLGILINYRPFIDNSNIDKINSYAYFIRDDMYVFFDTIVDMNDYILYGNPRVKRAYMKEEEFDEYYDYGLDVPFEEVLNWIEK